MCLEQLPGFPKIHTLGKRETAGIFDGEVEITEKLDGSSIAFGNINGELLIRSKSRMLNINDSDRIFKTGVEVIKEIDGNRLLRDGFIYYGEYLHKNKHNTLCYDRVPNNNIALFGVFDTHNNKQLQYDDIEGHANWFGLDVVPLLFRGNYPLQKEGDNSLIAELMKKESYLGKAKIEGLVFKNYNNDNFILAKYVSEEFKEVSHRKGKMYNGNRSDKLGTYLSQYCTKARWDKAIQHLREAGELRNSSEDIGCLLKELNKDLESECKEEIQTHLWKMFGKEVFRIAGHGFPQYYLNLLKDELSTQVTNTGIINDIQETG